MKHNSIHALSGHPAPATPALSSRGTRSNSQRFSTFAVCLLAATAFGQAAAHAATYTVINTSNTGVGSLRQAVTDANASAGADTINFNIPGTGVQTISLTTVLPSITDAVTIDGYSQPGSSANTLATGNNAVILIEVRGTTVLATGFNLGIANCTIGGLSLGNFTAGILLNNGASNTIVKGNYIGVRADGTTRLANSQFGVQCVTAGNTIGGITPADRNVISGSGNSGILLNTGSLNNTVIGNYIGTNASGTAAIGNSTGILVQGPNPPSASSTQGNIIGGSTSGERNVISGNSVGINIVTFSFNNTVKGNYIGTQADGITPLGNTNIGVNIRNVPNNTIGGIAPGEGNVISNNTGSGVLMGSSNNATAPATGNIVRGNSISANGGLGIDLSANPGNSVPDGVTLNDAGDADGGANLSQNFPVLTSVDNSGIGGNGVIAGTLNSTASSTFNIDFYDNVAADPTGYGEGQTYLGSQTVTTDGNGNGTFTLNLTSPLTSGRFVSATATDAANNTSEFSFARPFGPNTAPKLNNATYTGAVSSVFTQQLPGTDPQNDAVTYALASGTLPDGLTLDSATGIISGTPTTAGRSDFTVTVTDGITPAITAKFIIIISAAGTDGVGPVLTRAPLNPSYTRAELASLLYTGTVRDVAQTATPVVAPVGVKQVLFQLRQGATAYSGNETDGFTADLNRGYFPAFLSAPNPNTTAGTSTFRRNFASFIPSTLAAGSYSIVILGQDNLNNFSVEVVPVTITAPAAQAAKSAFGVTGSANGS